jgi:hypothetical protein
VLLEALFRAVSLATVHGYILYTIYYIHAFQIITVLLKLVKKLNMKF